MLTDPDRSGLSRTLSFFEQTTVLSSITIQLTSYVHGPLDVETLCVAGDLLRRSRPILTARITPQSSSRSCSNSRKLAQQKTPVRPGL
ncbi:Uncharacterised protein [Mycobacteroides abscessus subsp. massiliense]|nr:Uncharacterised protein [Mycobacteroides abscessus subsp. massiliense]SKH53369.1 Uncharacterised protein [Mycobacteroides abscessus subsp. massiliense]SKH96224.1 Uncharacterised protein [Mycobacteroides abscessus subsp. massiliense]SKI92339.1 Uncharacterised protein [Mycobacteroides abscessus subsp. massiliense]SKJ46239.1 Uncharacterised protein [Mycobacteroides abscessus subsp. massiliense]